MNFSETINLFAHGFVLKYMTFGLAGTAGFFESIGFPGWTAYLVFFGETAGALALILGIGTRWVSLATLPILLGAGAFSLDRQMGLERTPEADLMPAT